MIWIKDRLIGNRAHSKRRARAFGKDAGANVADADGAAGLIQRAHDDLRLSGESQLLCSLRQNGAEKRARFNDLRQAGFVNSEIIQHLRPILLRADIPHGGGAPEGAFSVVAAAETEEEVVLNQQEFCG